MEQIPETLVTKFEEPADVKIFDGFKDMAEAELKELYASLGLAMTFKDFQHIQNYFKRGRGQRSVHDRDPCSGHLLVRSLPSYHILYRAYRCEVRGRRLYRHHWKRHTDSILQTTVRFSKAEKINSSA